MRCTFPVNNDNIANHRETARDAFNKYFSPLLPWLGQRSISLRANHGLISVWAFSNNEENRIIRYTFRGLIDVIMRSLSIYLCHKLTLLYEKMRPPPTPILPCFKLLVLQFINHIIIEAYVMEEIKIVYDLLETILDSLIEYLMTLLW